MHVDDLRYKPHPCELMLLTESHTSCAFFWRLVLWSEHHVLNCSSSGFFGLTWCLLVLPIPTIDEILKCPPLPSPHTPLYEFVYGFGQIDWDARIPSTSHVVLMTSHLNGLETFPIFPKKSLVGLCESYQFSKNGNRDMGMGQSLPKRCLWTPPKGFLLGNLQNIHTNVACVARKPKCEQDPNDGAQLWKKY